MRYGLLEDIGAFADYILGNNTVPWVPYNESGNWEPWLPQYENQTTKLGQETSGCTVWASQNQVETLYKFIYNVEPNYSERFTYNLVPINPAQGTDPQNTHETIRRHGLIDDKSLPMTSSLEEYVDKSKITGSLLAQGQFWLRKHDYKHEWLWKSKPENYMEILQDALKTSPIAVSVSAWNEVNGEYVSTGKVNNHYCLLYKIEDGHPWIFDSYDHSKKKLSKDHNIRRAKRIWLNKRTRPAMALHIRLLQSIVNTLMNKKSILDVVKQNLGTDVTPEDKTPDEVACVETVVALLSQLYSIPKEVSTIRFDNWLRSPQSAFVRISEPVEGCIIISPTKSPERVGHVGIVMEDNTIASNTSSGPHKGKFIKNYTVETWVNHYQKKLGLDVIFYKKT